MRGSVAIAPPAPRHTTIHGVLVHVQGCGVLLLGKSGIGKSECALDLIQRGHALVADDAIDVSAHGDNLRGRPTPLLAHHLEVRGLGILDIRLLFGDDAVRAESTIDIVVELMAPGSHPADRSGFAQPVTTLLGHTLPRVCLRASPATNITTLVEVAVRSHRLRKQGVDVTTRFAERISHHLRTQHLASTGE